MTAVTHMVAGLVVTQMFPNPALGLPLAFASHFLLDALPHNDYVYAFSGTHWAYAHQSGISRGLLIGGSILVAALALTTTSPLLALAGAGCGIAPDVVSKLLKRAGRPHHPFNLFHSEIHTSFSVSEYLHNRWGVGEKVAHAEGFEGMKKTFPILRNSRYGVIGWGVEIALELLFLMLLIRSIL